MRKIVLGTSVIIALLSGSSCSDPDQVEEGKGNLPAASAVTPSVQVVRYEKLQEVISTSAADITVVNFWATWCLPCIRELPHFFELKEEWEKKDSTIEWIFVSLDGAKEINEKVVPFLTEKGFGAGRHFLLDDNGRQQVWIDVFSPEWSGGLPATFIYRKGILRQFHEGFMSRSELEAGIIGAQ